MKEKDLYLPIKDLLEELNYIVKSEVNHTDITAMKNDELIIVEMKTSLSLKLLIQATKRQKLTDKVYIAIPRPIYKKRFGKDFKDKEYLLKRLNLGLILVATESENPYAKIIFKPKEFNINLSQVRSKKKKNNLLKEFSERHDDFNIGGICKEKIITAYKEKVLIIAYHLTKSSKSIKELKEETNINECGKILQKNYYNWFNRVQRGVYELTSIGESEIKKYENIINKLIN